MKEQQIPKSVLGYLWFLYRQYKWLFILSGLCLSLYRLLDGFAFPWLISKMTEAIELYAGEKEFFLKNVGKYLIYIFIAHTLSEIILWAGILLRRAFIPKIRTISDQLLFSYVKKHSYQYFSSELSGKIASKIGDVSNSLQSMQHAFFWTFLPILVLIPVNIFVFLECLLL